MDASATHYSPFAYRPPAPCKPTLPFSMRGYEPPFALHNKPRDLSQFWKVTFDAPDAEELIFACRCSVLDYKLGAIDGQAFVSSTHVSFLPSPLRHDDRKISNFLIPVSDAESWEMGAKLAAPDRTPPFKIKSLRYAKEATADAVLVFTKDCRVHMLFDFERDSFQGFVHAMDAAWLSTPRNPAPLVAASPNRSPFFSPQLQPTAAAAAHAGVKSPPNFGQGSPPNGFAVGSPGQRWQWAAVGGAAPGGESPNQQQARNQARDGTRPVQLSPLLLAANSGVQQKNAPLSFAPPPVSSPPPPLPPPAQALQVGKLSAVQPQQRGAGSPVTEGRERRPLSLQLPRRLSVVSPPPVDPTPLPTLSPKDHL